MAPCARHCGRHLGIDWRLFTEVQPLTRAQLSFPEAEGRPRREDRCLFPAKGCRRGVQCPPLLSLGTPHLCSEPEPLSPRQHMALWPWPSLPLSNAEHPLLVTDTQCPVPRAGAPPCTGHLCCSSYPAFSPPACPSTHPSAHSLIHSSTHLFTQPLAHLPTQQLLTLECSGGLGIKMHKVNVPISQRLRI